MKSYKGLVRKYIKNEKRSIIPIFISIVLTISVITSVTFITENIVKNNGEEKKIIYGDYDIRLLKINSERLEKVKGNGNVKDFTLGKSNENLAVVNENKNNIFNPKVNKEQEKITGGGSKLEYINEYAVEKRFLEEYINFKTIDGRLPENEDEIVLDKTALNMLPENTKVGSVIEFRAVKLKTEVKSNINAGDVVSSDEEAKDKELELKKRIEEQIAKENEDFENSKKVKYKIVGIIERNKDDKIFGNKIVRLLTKEEMNNKSEEFEVFAYLKDPSKEAEIANELGLRYIKPGIDMINKYGYERSEVKYPGYDKGSYSSIVRNGLCRTILLITITFCFLSVYTTFQASIANRIKFYGILRAIGGSMKQIRYLIYVESLILYIVAIPLGLCIGYIITKIESYVLINYLGFLEKFSMSINIEVVLISIISTLFIVVSSIIFVLKKGGKLTPIEAIVDARGLNRNIEKEKSGRDQNTYDEERYIKELLDYEKTTVKFKIIRKIFKFEGELAQKNITRDIKTNKLSKLTIFIAMSIAIFFFLQIVNASVNGKSLIKTDKWDVELKLNGQEFEENVVDEINSVSGVIDVYKYSKEKASVVVPSESLSRKLKEVQKMLNRGAVVDGGFTGIKANIIGLDEKTLNLYEGIDKEALDNGGVLLVNKGSDYWISSSIDSIIYIYSHMNPVLNSKNLDKVQIAENDTVITKEGLEEYNKNKGSFKDINIVGTVDDDIIYSTYQSINMTELDCDIKLLTSEEGLKKIRSGSIDNSILISCENNEKRGAIISQLKKISANNNYELKDIIGDKADIEKNMKEKLGLNIIFAITVIIMVTLNLINTTNSSIMARRKELAAMRAIGMSYKQQRKMIIAENFYICLSVAFTVFFSVGILSNAALIPLIAAKKVNIITLLAGEVMVIAFLMIVSTLTVLAPLRKTKIFSIAEDLKEK